MDLEGQRLWKQGSSFPLVLTTSEWQRALSVQLLVQKGNQKGRGFAKARTGREGPVKSDTQEERLGAAPTLGPKEEGPCGKCCCLNHRAAVPGRQLSQGMVMSPCTRTLPGSENNTEDRLGGCQRGRGPLGDQLLQPGISQLPELKKEWDVVPAIERAGPEP